MRNHVLRPLWVAIGVVLVILLARYLVVPADFGVNGRNFTYGFHRLSNVKEWQDFKVKYKGKISCEECHSENFADNMASKHRVIQCENCHDPAIDHPENPEKLTVDRSRALCLRCHASLPYPGSGRMAMKTINPETHNPEAECSECHNPHKPELEEMQ